MARRHSESDNQPLPPLYAMVHGGLESVAADEIMRELGGEIKKTARGLVVFRVDEVTPNLLKLRTTEDVFLMAWGSDTLASDAGDLERIRKWTANKPDWPRLFRLHHLLRPKTKGRPTFNLICQMQGEHGYRRTDAREVFRSALEGIIPHGWQFSNENAWLEIWLTLHARTAVCGVRLSDRTMRHRTYKAEHIPASLRPTVAGAMARLAGIGPGMTVLDPMCGAGTILIEASEIARRRRGDPVRILGGDSDPNAIFVASQNTQKIGPIDLARWDSADLPLPNESVDRVICNPPFGKQLSSPEEVGPLYRAASQEWNRVLKPGGRAVLLAMEQDLLSDVLRRFRWRATQQSKVRLLGQPTILSVWQKPE
jgi:tRNA (guanine6-N2)-methyltransferase